MPRVVHHTKQGKKINMQQLAAKHALKPALSIGTAPYNARGDIIEKRGKIVLKTQEQIVAEFKRLKDLQNANEAELFDVKDPVLEQENAQFEPVHVNEEGDAEKTTPTPRRRKIVEAD